jgi:hypothetical protein
MTARAQLRAAALTGASALAGRSGLGSGTFDPALQTRFGECRAATPRRWASPLRGPRAAR